MTTTMRRWTRAAAHVAVFVAAIATALPASASRWEARREFREGQREIARERREMRREIMRANSPQEARRAYREGQFEIARERREMRREVHRELRYGSWDRDRNRAGEIIAGVVLGAVIVTAARGVAPPPPAPGLCWSWSDPYYQRGYWERCGAYGGY